MSIHHWVEIRCDYPKCAAVVKDDGEVGLLSVLPVPKIPPGWKVITEGSVSQIMCNLHDLTVLMGWSRGVQKSVKAKDEPSLKKGIYEDD